MLGTVHLGTFIATGLLLNIYPGPDTMYILGRSVSQGRNAGLISLLGIVTGALVHNIASGLGLSSILMASPAAFNFVKAAGSIYLFYLGIRTLLTKKNDSGPVPSYLASLSGFQIYRQGILTNLLNPKVALFFISFLPQFIAPAQNYGFFSFFFLGSIFITTGTIWLSILILFATRVTERLHRGGRWLPWLEKMTGIIFIFLGINMIAGMI